MIREGIQEIVKLAVEGAKPTIFRAEAEPEHIYYLTKPNGEVERVEAEPEPRSHTVYDLLSLATMVKEFAPTEEGGGYPVAVWVSREGVTAILDDSTRRDTVTLPLKVSPQMALLGQWAGSIVWQEQTKLVQTLRIYLARFMESGVTVDLFRRLKFRVAQSGEKVVEHGRASIGKSLEAELTGTNTLPTDITVYIPAFSGPLSEVYISVRLLVEVDAQNERIALVPEAGSVEGAWGRVEEELRKRVEEVLEGVDCSIYRGKP